MKRLIFAVVASVLMVGTGRCQQSKADLIKQEEFARKWHAEHDEEIRAAGKAIEAIGKMNDMIDVAVKETYDQCKRAFFHDDFCKCVSNNTPVSLNFVGFIAANALEAGSKQLADSMPVEAAVNARIAMKQCMKK